MAALDQREMVLKNKVFPFVRVAWDPNSPEDSSWELEEEIQKKCPYMFPNPQVPLY